MANEHRVTWTTGLFVWTILWTIFWIIFWTFFLDYFRTILSGGGGRPLVLRKGWNAFYQSSGRGGRQTIVTNGGVVIRTHGGVGG